MGENYKCDICGVPATVHLTQIVDGKIHKVHLCEKCAAKSRIAELPILKFTEMLAKTLAAGGKKAGQEASGVDAAGRVPKKICPVCGMTDVIFEKKNLFGCAHCYETFAEKIEEFLPKIQKGKTYCGDVSRAGKTKKSGGNESSETSSEKVLRERLNAAVANEDYALAARLRDELRAREAEKKSVAGTKKSVSKTRKSEKKKSVSSAEKTLSPRARSRGGKKTEGRRR